MRIAFFHNLPSGGGKRSAHEWIKRMTQKHSVDLYLYDPAAEDFLDLKPLVNRTVLVPGITKSYGGIGVFLARHQARVSSREVARRINTGDYDLAFIMQCGITNSPYVLRHLRIPSLYFCHEPLAKILEPHFRANDGRLGFLKVAFLKGMVRTDRANARHATLICANSLFSRETIYLNYGIYPRLNYLGVDTAHFQPLNLRRKRVILSVGSLTAIKGQDFIIESVATLKDPPQIDFIYNSGSEDYKSKLSDLAKHLNIPVSFDCLPSQDDLVMAYNQAAVTAFPSRLEPLGLVPLESQACETPLVGVAEGGIRETVKHGETGLLTERDPVEFGRALEMLLKDEALRRRMGVAGRREVSENWTWERSYAQLEKNMERVFTRVNR